MRNVLGMSRSERVRLLRGGNWLIAPLYVFLVFLPLYYEWSVVLPPTEALQREDGILTYKDIPKAGTMIGVTRNSITTYFTCRDGYFDRKHTCTHFYDRKTRPLAGMPVSVWWFDQPVYPFCSQRRLVRLELDGEELISFADTIWRIERKRRLAPWYALGLLLFFIWVAVYFESLARRVERRQGDGERNQ